MSGSSVVHIVACFLFFKSEIVANFSRKSWWNQWWTCGFDKRLLVQMAHRVTIYCLDEIFMGRGFVGSPSLVSVQVHLAILLEKRECLQWVFLRLEDRTSTSHCHASSMKNFVHRDRLWDNLYKRTLIVDVPLVFHRDNHCSVLRRRSLNSLYLPTRLLVSSCYEVASGMLTGQWTIHSYDDSMPRNHRVSQTLTT